MFHSQDRELSKKIYSITIAAEGCLCLNSVFTARVKYRIRVHQKDITIHIQSLIDILELLFIKDFFNATPMFFALTFKPQRLLLQTSTTPF